ncbi:MULTISPECIES: alpha/beta fold hydrolase [unclassified Clostridium]|uniref:alpha/beta hydrolase n=1 Tax=unclassified Clostridium TaxID=2614128 RepID=UPI0002978D0B|nr:MULTISPECIES: alpha/beta fold hydrolase [unclassified Clostridium]EKQ57698.1 MAG: lysophospholipase [Clostridium sp. Maddingley MBC34-26]
MNINRQLIQGNGFTVPSILITPLNSIGAAVIIHGIGSCKEEHLGFAWRMAESGFTTCVIDLRGHGEHKLEFDENIVLDVEAAIEYCRRFGKVVSIGHSLGGRLSLICNADYSIGISPAIYKTICDQTIENLKIFRNHRIRQTFSNVEIFNKIPMWQVSENKPTMIFFGSRDSQDILLACDNLKSTNVSAIKINGALHSDIFLLEETFDKVIKKLKKWF